MTFVQEGDDIRIYLNGDLEDSEDMGSNLGSSYTDDYTIGKDIINNDYFDGFLDEINIYPSAITAENIYDLYLNGTFARHYEFDNTHSDSITGYNNTVTAIQTTFGPGKVGSALELNSSALMEITKIDLYRGETLSFWINFTKIYDHKTDFVPLFGYGTSPVPDMTSRFISWTVDDYIVIKDNSGLSKSIAFENPSTYLNQWAMVTLVFDVSTINAYLNGEFIGSANQLSNLLSLNYFGRGKQYSRLDGSVDDLRVYDRVLTEEQIEDLYWSFNNYQEKVITSNLSLNTTDMPSISMSMQIEEGQPVVDDLVESYVTIGATDYGIKLHNGVWKFLNGTSIGELSNNLYGAYTINFDILEYGSVPSTKLTIYVNNGTHQLKLEDYSISNNQLITSTISSGDGYLITPHISIIHGLGSSIYPDSAAQGSWTQGAFALKYSQETKLETVNLDGLEDEYETFTLQDDKGLINLANDFWTYVNYGKLDLDPSDEPCSVDPGNCPASTNPYYTGTDGFVDIIDEVHNLDLIDDYQWLDRWFDDVMYALEDGEASDILTHEIDSNTRNFYYNVPIEVSDTISVQVTVTSTSGSYKLHLLDGPGSISETLSSTGTNSATWTYNLNSYHYFYLQLENGATASDVSISFDPQSSYKYAHLVRMSGEDDSLVMQSTYTGLNSTSETPIDVSYVEYKTDDQGSYELPIYHPLSEDDGDYYLNRMIALGGLPIKSEATKFGDIVTVVEYGKIDGLGQKLVEGSTYWETCTVACSEDEKTYSLDTDNDGEFILYNSKRYMFSLDIINRYSADTIDLEIEVNKASNIAVYYDGENEITQPSPSVGSYYNTYNYQIRIGSTHNSIIIKMQSDYYNGAASRIRIKLPDFVGDVGYTELVDDVEEFTRTTLSANDYVTDMVYGMGFNDNSLNEKTDAQVPGDARASLNEAINTNPTENRVFDVKLLLEQVVSDFANLKSDVKDEVYDILTIEIDAWAFTYEDTKIADFVWDLLDKYGFGSIESIINWFDDEERQENLANLILNDDDLRRDLNYNGEDDPDQDLDYFAVAKAAILLFADYIHDNHFCQYIVMTFVSYHVPSILTANTDFMSKYQIRLEDEERSFWQKYANRYFRGNLAKMIRTFVTQAILSGDLEKDSELPDELVDAIIEIKTNSKETTETVGSFQSDLIIMKSLLSQIISVQDPILQLENDGIEANYPEAEIRDVIKQLLEDTEDYVEVQDVILYLMPTQGKKLENFDELSISILVDELRNNLFEETGEERFKVKGGNQFDF